MFLKKASINYLSMIPVRAVKELTGPDGRITLLIPKFKNPFFQKLFIPKRKSPFFRIHLDEQGSRVWQQIDGKHNVDHICSALSGSFDSESAVDHSLEYRVTKYLTELYKNRFIVFDEKSKL
jgi:hypothetical protein